MCCVTTTSPAFAGRPAPGSAGTVPGPRGWPLLGSLPDFARDPLAFFSRLRDEYGDWAEWRLGTQRNVMLSHPDQVAEVLAQMESTATRTDLGWAFRQVLGDGVVVARGEDWRRKRALVQPAVRPRQVRAYAATMVDCAAETAASWEPGQGIELHSALTALTRRIAVRTLFGTDIAAGREDAIGEAMAVAQAEIGAELRGVTLFLPPWVPTAGRRRLRAAVDRLDEEIDRVVAAHRATHRSGGAERDDLLSRLLAARDAHGAPLSGKELRDEAVTLYIGGHETTSTALTWLWYRLAGAPEARARLDAELAEVLPDGRLPGFDDYARLTWTQQLVKESLRLYPPIWLSTAIALEGARVGGRDVAPGTRLWFSTWSLQRDPRWFADPEEFRPERWSPDAAPGEALDAAWVPFGGGPRTCLGARFAQVEAVLLTAVIAQRFRAELPDGLRIDPVPHLTLQPSAPIPVTLAAV